MSDGGNDRGVPDEVGHIGVFVNKSHNLRHIQQLLVAHGGSDLAQYLGIHTFRRTKRGWRGGLEHR